MVIVLTTMLLLHWNIYVLLGALKHHLRDIVTNKLHEVRVWSQQISCNMNGMLFVIIDRYTALTPALRQTCIFSYIYKLSWSIMFCSYGHTWHLFGMQSVPFSNVYFWLCPSLSFFLPFFHLLLLLPLQGEIFLGWETLVN